MASQADPPLDEIQWRSPQLVQQFGGIHSNTVLPYFQESPFFDPTSNNGIVTNIAMRNPNMYHIIQTRQAYEDYLSGMAGTEYRVVQDPSDNDRIPTFQHSGVWVIRKQRRSQVDVGEGINKRKEIVTEVLSTYFVVGENVYMAPTVGSILGSRVLSASHALCQLFRSAYKLPIYNPALGRVYTLPIAKSVTASASALNTSQNSKEPTPMPEAQPPSLPHDSAVPEDSTTGHSDQQSATLLAETLSNSLRHGREYMDEHPLMGEPGSFMVQKSKDLQVPVGKENAGGEKRVTPVPPPLKTDLQTEVGKKTKGVTSPVGGEKSPLSPTGAAKKRKKSKVQTPRTPKTPR